VAHEEAHQINRNDFRLVPAAMPTIYQGMLPQKHSCCPKVLQSHLLRLTRSSPEVNIQVDDTPDVSQDKA